VSKEKYQPLETIHIREILFGYIPIMRLIIVLLYDVLVFQIWEVMKPAILHFRKEKRRGGGGGVRN
jgi:hypothetical protein